MNNGQFDELQFKDEKIELAESKPVYLPDGFRNISLGDSQLAKAFVDISRNAALTSRSFQDTVSATVQWVRHMGTLSSRFIIEDNLGITMLEMLSAKGPDIITQTKISPVWENSLSSLIMTHWRCIGRYSFAKEHLMLSQSEIELLPQWVKLLASTKSMSYLNPHAKDILYCWTQMPRDMQSILRSNLLPIKGQGGVLPDGKDVNDLGRKQTLKLVYQTRYQSYQELVQIKNSLE